MKLPTLNSIKERKESKAPVSERAECIGLFLTKLNSERGKYPPLKASRVAVMLSVFKTCSQLRQFYGTCNESKSFSKYFWWSLNPKNYK